MSEAAREGSTKKRCFHQITLKGSALLDLIDAGVIQPDENGDVDTDGFERFWSEFEKRINAEISVRTSRKICETFIDRHPDLPLHLSIIALIVSIVVPILRKFLEGMT